MVEIAEIVDHDGYEAWLKQEGLPRRTALSLGFRSAARTLPTLAASIMRDAERASDKGQLLSIFRSLLTAHAISGANHDLVVFELGEAAVTAARSVKVDSADKSSAVGLSVRSVALTAYSAAASDDIVFQDSTDDAVVLSSFVIGAEKAYYELRADCWRVANNQRPIDGPLWQEAPQLYKQTWQSIRDDFRQIELNPLAFWLDWYQRLLDGTEDRWDLLTDIALLDKDADGNDLWQDPPKLAAEIARLEAEYAPKHAPVAPVVDDAPLAEVIAATPNAERVEYAPEKEAIHTVPLSDLPVDHLRDALDRLTDASEVFGPPDGFNNQYLALIPDIDKLRRALDRYANRPLRLHDVAADLSARLDNRIRNGECPETEKDALVASYKADLAGAMVDLQAHDPRVVEAVRARLTLGVDSVQDADLEVIEAGVAAAAKITNDVLRAELLEDLATIKDPHASPEEGRQAIYRLGSRLPRILWVYRKESVEAFLKVTGVGQALEWTVSIIIRLFVSGG